jgi:hypothetical protein
VLPRGGNETRTHLFSENANELSFLAAQNPHVGYRIARRCRLYTERNCASLPEPAWDHGGHLRGVARRGVSPACADIAGWGFACPARDESGSNGARGFR